MKYEISMQWTCLLVLSPEPPSYQTPGLTACQEPLQDWSSSLKKVFVVLSRLKITNIFGEKEKKVVSETKDKIMLSFQKTTIQEKEETLSSVFHLSMSNQTKNNRLKITLLQLDLHCFLEQSLRFRLRLSQPYCQSWKGVSADIDFI